MREIVNGYSKRAFATVLLYGLYCLFVNKVFIFPFPIYEIIYFLLSLFWFLQSLKRREDPSFFRIQFILAILWILSSSMWLEFVLSHEKVEQVFYIFPILEGLFLIGFISVGLYYEYYKKFQFKYRQLYWLIIFLVFTKFYNLNL